MESALASSVNPSWHTPQEYIDAARAIMGTIHLDPASDAKANARIQAQKFYSKEDDGLSKEWHGNVFLNPPGRIWKDFLYKAHDEFNAGRINQLFYLAFSQEQINKIEPTEWDFDGRDVILAIPWKRIRFLDPETGLKGKSPTKANAILMVLQPERTPQVRLHLNHLCNLWTPFP